MRRVATSTVFIAAVTLLLLHAGIHSAYAETYAKGQIPVFDAPLSIDKTAQVASTSQTLNPLHMLVVFTQFKGEAPGDTLAPWWAPNLFNGQQGSVTYYFNEISHGAINITGDYYPKRLELPYEKLYYKDGDDDYTYQVLKMLDRDPDFSFADYDNDGPDGIPASGDDDGYVDFLVLMPMSVPEDFIWGAADGLSSLGIADEYTSKDKDASWKYIRVKKSFGALASANSLHKATGLICHEFIHDWGIIDLYDLSYDVDDYATDSAGIGYWGIMGRGIMGWNYAGGPVGPSAYTRMKMGIIGVGNNRLMDLFGVHKDVTIQDIGTSAGEVYRIWASKDEYFLVEFRSNDTLYCDRNLPGDGLLIWHIDKFGGNTNENGKLCDLECADGLYADYGYPKGEIEKTVGGRDNLDFWAHDESYCEMYIGNLGDKTDMFDGIRFTEFTHSTNPNTTTSEVGKTTGIQITNIRHVGNSFIFDVVAPINANVYSVDPDELITDEIDWYNEVINLIGLGYQRYMPVVLDSLYAEAEPALYVMKQSGNYYSADDKLITVYPDSVTVDTVGLLDSSDAEQIIRWRYAGINQSGDNYIIHRDNIPFEDFSGTMSDLGVDAETLCSSGSVPGIQKIVSDADRNSHPEQITLYQNYPNPFNAATTIRFNLPESDTVTLDVYSVLGQKVLSRDCGYLPRGIHRVNIDMEGAASGLYLYRINGRMMSNTQKMVLMK